MTTELYIAIFFFSIEIHKAFKEDLLPDLLYAVSGNKEMEIGKRSSGKPFFIVPKNWYFNISHSKEIGVCAIGHSELGIDIERMKEKRDIFSLSEACFEGKESALLQQHPDRAFNTFYHLWTRKESLIKKQGKSVWQIKNLPSLIDESDDMRTWYVKTEKENFSLSLSADLKKKKKMKIDIFTEYYNSPIRLIPVSLSF